MLSRLVQALCLLGVCPTPTQKIAPPTANLVVGCTDAACTELILDASSSTGQTLTFTWFHKGIRLQTRKSNIVVSRQSLRDDPYQVRIGNSSGYAWSEVLDLDDGAGIIDSPDPIVITKDGQCGLATMAYEPANPAVQGCVIGFDRLGIRWFVNGGSANKAIMTPQLDWMGQPYLRATEAGSIVHPPILPPVLFGAPTAPAYRWQAYWRVDGADPMSVSAPPTLAPGGMSPAPLVEPGVGVPMVHMTHFLYGLPGEVVYGGWMAHEDDGTTYDYGAVYEGLTTVPAKHSGTFRMDCEQVGDKGQTDRTNPNLPLVTMVPPSYDVDGDGHAAFTDCNDFDPTIHPDAVELSCDAIDSNCDGVDSLANDLDGDGFDACGTTIVDCDDSDPTISPGATEIPGNTIDENCDGLAAGCDPTIHDVIILPGSDIGTEIATHVPAGTTPPPSVCIEEGTYGGFDLNVPVNIVTAPNARVIIDAQQLGRGIHISATATNSTLHGLEVRNGLISGDGAGLTVISAQVSLTEMVIADNVASGRGGGIHAANGADLVLDGVVLHNNSALFGGAISMDEQGSLVLTDVSLEGNDADSGGAVYAVSDIEITATRVLARDNDAIEGGALYLGPGTDSHLEEFIAIDNHASQRGGAIRWDGFDLTLDWSTIVGNVADQRGGGILLVDGGTADLGRTIVAHNSAPEGGGLALLDAVGNPLPNATWDMGQVLLFDNTMLGSASSTPADSPPPEFVLYGRNLPSELWDMHLRYPGPTTDRGATRGMLADPTWYVDSDSDQLWDGLEFQWLGSLSEDGTDDHDMDMVSNANEAENGTQLHVADSDGDSWSDGQELGVSDPLDPASTP